MFKTVWGSDRDNEGAPRPLDNTSYGHNIEFLWLFLHALEVLGQSVDPYRERLAKLARAHAEATAWTRVHGGVFVEGPHDGPARDLQKEFWQQAESLVGLLDATCSLGDRAYWDAFRKVFDFVWEHLDQPRARGVVRAARPGRHGPLGLPRPRVEEQLPHHAFDGADAAPAEENRAAGDGPLSRAASRRAPLCLARVGGQETLQLCAGRDALLAARARGLDRGGGRGQSHPFA